MHTHKGVPLTDHRAVENLLEQGWGLEAGGGEWASGTGSPLANDACL